MIKGSVCEEDNIVIILYGRNMGAPKYIRQILTNRKEEINGNTLIVDLQLIVATHRLAPNSNLQLIPMDTSSTQRINRATETLKVHMEHSLGLTTSVQFSSVAQLCPTLCNPMNRSTPGLPVHHQLLEFTQTHVYRVGDAIQPSHPLSSPFSSCPQSLPASRSFPMSQLFA